MINQCLVLFAFKAYESVSSIPLLASSVVAVVRIHVHTCIQHEYKNISWEDGLFITTSQSQTER